MRRSDGKLQRFHPSDNQIVHARHPQQEAHPQRCGGRAFEAVGEIVFRQGLVDNRQHQPDHNHPVRGQRQKLQPDGRKAGQRPDNQRHCGSGQHQQRPQNPRHDMPQRMPVDEFFQIAAFFDKAAQHEGAAGQGRRQRQLHPARRLPEAALQKLEGELVAADHMCREPFVDCRFVHCSVPVLANACVPPIIADAASGSLKNRFRLPEAGWRGRRVPLI